MVLGHRGITAKELSLVRKYYRVLIRLPSLRLLAITYVVLLVTFFTINHTYFIFMIIQTLIYTTYAFLSKTLVNYRRALALSIITTLYSLLLDLMLGFGVGLASSIALQVPVLIGLDGVKSTSFLIPTITYFLTIVSTQNFKALFVTLGLASSLYTIVLDLLIYKYLSRYSVGGYSSVEIGRMFLRNRLAGDMDIEILFERLSKLAVVRPCLFVSGNVVVVHTDLHYGPFYDTGSSSLPKQIHQRLRERGYEAIVLHGAGSHDRNLPRSSLSKLVTSEILINLDKLDKCSREKLHGFFQLRGKDNWEIKGVVFEKTTIIFLSRPHSGIDDVPYYIQKMIEEEFSRRGLGKIIIIDSHNWELVLEPDYEALKELVLDSAKSITRLKEETPADPIVRYACVDADLKGLIDKRICGLEIAKKNSDERFVLIYLRGNNMEAGLRNRIVELVSKRYGSRTLVEVVSNDEHSETGVHALYLYRPISCEKGLEKTIDRLMDQLITREYFEGLRTTCFEENLPLLDDGAYRLLTVLKKAFPKALALLLTLVATAPLFLKLASWLLRM